MLLPIEQRGNPLRGPTALARIVGPDCTCLSVPRGPNRYPPHALYRPTGNGENPFGNGLVQVVTFDSLYRFRTRMMRSLLTAKLAPREACHS